jgi:hypothetical protein
VVIPHLHAHINGVPTPANIQAPADLGIVVDDRADLSWLDNDADPTGKFNFFFQAQNVPPSTQVSDGSLAGTAIPEAQGVPISDPADTLSWDTREVPAGSYFVYAITDDPPIPPVYGMSRGVITVRHPGDPLFPATRVIAPGDIAPSVDQEGFALRWEASGDGPFSATLSYAALGTGAHPIEPMWLPLAAGLAMTPVGDRATGCLVWDLAAFSDGYYAVRVVVTDGAGRTHSAYAPNDVTVYHDGTSGPAASCAAPVPDAGPDDAGTGPDGSPAPPDDPGGCGCQAGGASGAPLPSELLLLGLAFWLSARAAGATARSTAPSPCRSGSRRSRGRAQAGRRRRGAPPWRRDRHRPRPPGTAP